MVPSKPATVDVYGCHTAVRGPHIAGCRSRARAVEKACMELTDCRVLLERLKYLYHTAKKSLRGDHTTYVRQALEMSKQYTTKFAQTLAKAALDLFAFILYDLEPTNNHSERVMRFVVGHRNVRMQVYSNVEMQYVVGMHQYMAVARQLDIP